MERQSNSTSLKAPLGEHEIGCPHQLDPETHALLQAISEQPGGSVCAMRVGVPSGFIVSLTDHRVTGDALSSLRRIRRLANVLAALNPSVADSLVLGWWRDEGGDLYIDLGMALDEIDDAFGVARAFSQREIAIVNEHGADCVAVVRRCCRAAMPNESSVVERRA